MTKSMNDDQREEQKEIIRSRLNDLIISTGVTQADIARATALTDKQISSYANATQLAEVQNLRKIADYFHVSVDYLIGRDDSPRNDKPFTTAGEVVDALDRVRRSVECSMEIIQSDDDSAILDFQVSHWAVVRYFAERAKLINLFGLHRDMRKYETQLLQSLHDEADAEKLQADSEKKGE